MLLRRAVLRDGGLVTAAFTTRDDGDYADGASPPPTGPRPHTWLRQVHGASVVRVESAGGNCAAPADAALTTQPDVALTIRTADCAPIALIGAGGAIAAVHAGWHGLATGVIEAAVEAVRDIGETDIRAVVGPCIHSECYEFGDTDLAVVERRVGAAVRTMTSWGTPALDLPAAVGGALFRAGVTNIDVIDRCTACDATLFFSHRARRDAGRHVMVLWRSVA